MKEAFEKIKERLEKLLGDTNFEKATQEVNESFYDGLAYAYGEALSIVSEVEAELGKDINVRSNKSTEHINKSSDCSTGWIPVEERLPENDDDVLVWYRYRMMQGVNIVGSKEMHGIGHYYEPTGSWLVYGGFGLDQNVIAWLPLPESYRRESE